MDLKELIWIKNGGEVVDANCKWHKTCVQSECLAVTCSDFEGLWAIERFVETELRKLEFKEGAKQKYTNLLYGYRGGRLGRPSLELFVALVEHIEDTYGVCLATRDDDGRYNYRPWVKGN